MNATGVTAGPTESNGRLLLSKWRDSLHVTCGLTACTPGSAPGPTLGNEYGKTLLYLTTRRGGELPPFTPPPAAPLHYVASGRSSSIPAVAVDVDDACRRVAATLVAARAVFERDADERWRLLLLVPRGVVVVVVVVVVGGRQESAVRALAARVAGARRVAAARRGRAGGGGGGYHGDGRAGARTRRYTLRVAHRRRRTSARCTRHAPPQTRGQIFKTS